MVTGASAAPIVSDFLEEFGRRAAVRFRLFPVPNRLMGESVTVTGLLGGNDIVSAVAGKAKGTLFIPSVALRDAGDLLDPMRMVLDDFALRNVRRAIEITGQGLMEGMKVARPGLTERSGPSYTLNQAGYMVNAAQIRRVTGRPCL